MILNEQILEAITEKISDELLKRGINVSLSVEEKDGIIWVSSTPFQTMPVIFKRIEISTSGKIITEQVKNSKGEELTRCRLPLSIDARMEYFDHATNGVQLFRIELVWIDGSNMIHIRQY